MPIPASEVLEYYEQVKDGRFNTHATVQFRLIDIDPSELKSSQINLSDEETQETAALRMAAQLSDRASQGEDFRELAQNNSHGPRRSRGGLWPPLRDPNSFNPPYKSLAKRAWNMPVGRVFEPIQINGHVFVLKLEQKVQESVQLFDEVKDILEEELRTLKRRKFEEGNLILPQGS